MTAIEKINNEMQKKPDDKYREIIGHYLIDRCADPAAAECIGEAGKTLEGALGEVQSAARKKARGSVAVMTDDEVFDIIDKYFSLGRYPHARIAALQGVADTRPAVSVASLDLSDFL